MARISKTRFAKNKKLPLEGVRQIERHQQLGLPKPNFKPIQPEKLHKSTSTTGLHELTTHHKSTSTFSLTAKELETPESYGVDNGNGFRKHIDYIPIGTSTFSKDTNAFLERGQQFLNENEFDNYDANFKFRRYEQTSDEKTSGSFIPASSTFNNFKSLNFGAGRGRGRGLGRGTTCQPIEPTSESKVSSAEPEPLEKLDQFADLESLSQPGLSLHPSFSEDERVVEVAFAIKGLTTSTRGDNNL